MDVFKNFRLTPRERNRYRAYWEMFTRNLKRYTYHKVRRTPSVKLEVAKVSHRRHKTRRNR